MALQIFRTAIKNVFNRSNSSAISLLGLTIAFVSIFYIYSYVSYELSYDTKYKNADRIYRISGEIVASENTMTHAILGPLMGQGLKDEFPEVEEFARLSSFRQAIFLENNKEKFKIEEAYIADHSVFDMFSLEFVYGDTSKALVAPDQVVINQSLSEKIFGKINPVGKILKQNNRALTIQGVIKDSPTNVHHKLNVLFSKPDFDVSSLDPMSHSEGFWMPSAYTFIRLKPKCNISAITGNFGAFYTKYMATFGTQINSKFNLIAIPMKDLHFSRYMSYDFPKGNKSYTYILVYVGLFIFLIAFFNYGNLLVFQSISNSKNIGIKKIIGASRLSLYFQFLVGSVLFVSVSVVLALILFRLSLPYSKIITSITPSELVKGNGILLVSVLLIALTSFISSLVPFFNQYKKQGLSLITTENSTKITIKGLRFGKSVAVAQFALSVILIIASIAITKQLRFLVDSDMGFDKNNVVLVNLPNENINLQQVNSLKAELEKSKLVARTAVSSHVPGEVLASLAFQIDKEGQKVTKIVNHMRIDYDYIPLMGMELKAGRNFDVQHTTDEKQSIVVNQAFVDFCGLDDSILDTGIAGVKVIGILKDVCFNSLHTQAEPVLFDLNDRSNGYLNVKLSTPNINQAINSIKKTWESFFPEAPFEYHFLDQRVAMLYENDSKKNILVQLFAIVSILISAMGFLNLASIISKQKTKEIGIRKVNGAKISEILILLNRDFVKWVAIAFVIATPIAWYAIHKWLENFAYKTSLSWWIFALAGLLALGIALLTVSWQSWKAATRNPVEALRYE